MEKYFVIITFILLAASIAGVAVFRKKISPYLMLAPLLGATLFFFAVTEYANHDETAKSIVINEVCSNNYTIIQNQYGDYSDYIELYNAGDNAVSLEGWSITSDSGKKHAYEFENVTLEPGAYLILIYQQELVLEETDDTEQPEEAQQEEQAVDVPGGTSYGYPITFHVSKSGDTVYLKNDAAKIVDAIKVPELKYNSVYARMSDGAEEWAVMTGTPGVTNAEASRVATDVKQPEFSVKSGFYTEPVSVTITAKKGTTIYYTLDGSDPVVGENEYTGPIEITDISDMENRYASYEGVSISGDILTDETVDKATVLRAIAVEPSGEYSEVTTATYFVGDFSEYDKYGVVSLVTDPDNLFSDDKGIYVLGDTYRQYIEAGGEYVYNSPANYKQRGREWEREATISYYDEDQNYVFSQNVGIRLIGNASRATPEKSFRVYARELYDDVGVLAYDFFDQEYDSETVLLRYGDGRSQFLMDLVDEPLLAVQQSRPCYLFIDGEYWGDYFIQERVDNELIENLFDVDADEVAMIKDGVMQSGDEECYTEYTEMLEYLKNNDMSDQENYEYICGKLDIENYIDYYCAQIYLNNTDYTINRNCVLWRSENIDEDNFYEDGKWRIVLINLDWTLNREGDYKTNSFTKKDVMMRESPATSIIFSSLMENEEFCEQFATRFMDLANTRFAADQIEAQIADVNYATDEEKDDWRDFFEHRFPYITKHMASVFGLKGQLIPVDIGINDTGAGSVRINTVEPDLSSGEWSGYYYSDYPVTIEAVPGEGYVFAGWSFDESGAIQSTDETVQIPLDENGIQIQAIFEKK